MSQYTPGPWGKTEQGEGLPRTREQAIARAFALVLRDGPPSVAPRIVAYSVMTAFAAYRALAARSTHVSERSEGHGGKQP